jgi:hypothetical protein
MDILITRVIIDYLENVLSYTLEYVNIVANTVSLYI